MAEQLDFFSVPERLGEHRDAPSWPEGFRFTPELIGLDHEHWLLDRVRTLPFREFEFHGYVGKRRTISFGWSYDFATERLQPAEALPEFLLELRKTAAAFAQTAPEELVQVLVSEYAPGAGIGWHRDKAVFGVIVGLSLGSSCQFRLRRKVGAKWERVTLTATPGSAYLLSEAARTEWEHSIPAVDAPRYSITFRTLRPADVSRRY